MELSNRLYTVAKAVTPGNRVADVGTDHGYVPIYLIEKGICLKAVAMDINKGPLERASEHIIEKKLSHKIETRLSNGLEKLKSKEIDTIVIAGMGGDLICRILAAAPQFLAEGKEFILQPQSEWFKVRHFLHGAGYQIKKEWFLQEEGKYYVIMKAIPCVTDGKEGCINRDEWMKHAEWLKEKNSYKSELYYEYGARLIEEKNAVLKEYLENEIKKKRNIAAEMKKSFYDKGENASNAEKRKKRIEELEREAGEIEFLLKKM